MGKEVILFFAYDPARLMDVSIGLSPDSLREHKMLLLTDSNTNQRHSALRM